MPPKTVPEPWLSFLREIDALSEGEIELHCLGGFVVTVVYGSERETSDIDVLTLVRNPPGLFAQAGIGSDLFKRYGLYLDPVGIATLPEDYEDRLVEIFAGTFDHIRLYAMDPYDIVLSKIERNADIDRQDALYLARAVPLDTELLKQRYQDEFRVYVKNERREDQTLELWIEMIEEEKA